MTGLTMIPEANFEQTLYKSKKILQSYQLTALSDFWFQARKD